MNTTRLGDNTFINRNKIMKNLKIAIAAVVLSTASFATLAAEPVTSAPLNAQEIGVVSARASNLSSLESKLAQKAQAQGATSYRITSASGNDRMFGTAVIYN
jgi:multiple stress resistance protein BhsA